MITREIEPVDKSVDNRDGNCHVLVRSMPSNKDEVASRARPAAARQDDRRRPTAHEDLGEYCYGPFFRLESPTQSSEVARQQQLSGQVWGRPRKDSNIPQVQAYIGPLPVDAMGIEFWTAVAPDKGCAHARWTGPRQGVVVEDGYAKISCRITKNTQTIPIIRGQQQRRLVTKDSRVEELDKEEEEEEEEILVAA